MAMREDALDMRLRYWASRLSEQQGDPFRTAVLERGLDAALSIASADFANIQLLHPTRRGLELKAERGFRADFLDFFAFVDGRDSACGRALNDCRLVAVEDVACSPIFFGTPGLEVVLEAGVRAVNSAPLRGPGGRILGVLSVHYREPRARVGSDLRRLQQLAHVIGACVENVDIEGANDEGHHLPELQRPVRSGVHAL